MAKTVINITSFSVLNSKKVQIQNPFKRGLASLIGTNENKYELTLKLNHQATRSIGPTSTITTSDQMVWKVQTAVDHLTTIVTGICYTETPNVIGKANVE